MCFAFLSPGLGACHATLLATGRYGFSLPKKVEITAPEGETYTYLYYNRKAGLKAELTNQVIVRIAIAQFLSAGPDARSRPVVIDDAVAPYDGELTQVRAASRPASLRVRPGTPYARGSASSHGDGAAQVAASTLE